MFMVSSPCLWLVLHVYGKLSMCMVSSLYLWLVLYVYGSLYVYG